MPELAYVNGVFGPIAEATVSIEDRGFQFGDGVYEVIATYGGRLFQLDAHLRRLRKSLAAIQLSYDLNAHPLEPIIEEGLRLSDLGDTMVYLQLTRGVAPRAHAAPPHMTPTLVMTFKPLPTVPDDLRRRGLSVMTTPDNRWQNCYVKAITLLPNTLAKSDAVRRGYDDAVFVTGTGEIRECTASNIFLVKDGKLETPPRTESILHGVTLGFLLECAAAIDLTVTERVLPKSALLGADEVFMSGTTVEALGITSIDDQPVGDGRVGPITQRLYEEFNRRVHGYEGADHPTCQNRAKS